MAASGAAAALQAWYASRSNNAGAGGGVEELALTKLVLNEVYKRPITDQDQLNIVSNVPEVGWLVECLCRAPLPPGWRKSKCAPGDVPLYCCEATGDVSETCSSFTYYVRLAELVMHARQTPDKASPAVAWVRAVRQEVRSLADSLRATWTGPYEDPATGTEYYHCPSTGVASWEDPSAWAMFLDGVSEQLLQSGAFKGEGIPGTHWSKSGDLEADETPEPEATPKQSARQSRRRESRRGSKDNGGADGVVQSDRILSALEQLDSSTMPRANAWEALDELDTMAGKIPSPSGKRQWASLEEMIASQAKHGHDQKHHVPAINGHRLGKVFGEDDQQEEVDGKRNLFAEELSNLQGSMGHLEEEIAQLKALQQSSLKRVPPLVEPCDAKAQGVAKTHPAGRPAPPRPAPPPPAALPPAPASIPTPPAVRPPPQVTSQTAQAPSSDADTHAPVPAQVASASLPVHSTTAVPPSSHVPEGIPAAARNGKPSLRVAPIPATACSAPAHPAPHIAAAAAFSLPSGPQAPVHQCGGYTAPQPAVVEKPARVLAPTAEGSGGYPGNAPATPTPSVAIAESSPAKQAAPSALRPRKPSKPTPLPRTDTPAVTAPAPVVSPLGGTAPAAPSAYAAPASANPTKVSRTLAPAPVSAHGTAGMPALSETCPSAEAVSSDGTPQPVAAPAITATPPPLAAAPVVAAPPTTAAAPPLQTAAPATPTMPPPLTEAPAPPAAVVPDVAASAPIEEVDPGRQPAQPADSAHSPVDTSTPAIESVVSPSAPMPVVVEPPGPTSQDIAAAERRKKIAAEPVADDMDVWKEDSSARGAIGAPHVVETERSAKPPSTAPSEAAPVAAPPSKRISDEAVADDMDTWAADASARDQKKTNASQPSEPARSKVQEKYANVDVADEMDEWAADLVGGGQERHQLSGLAARLSVLPFDENCSTIVELLEAIERIPATFEDLKVTQLGVITQPFKDSPHRQVRETVKRLRHKWKQVLKGT